MDTIKKLNSQQRLKKIDWKNFFDMRVFRYAILKQLKSVSTYVLFILTFIATELIMWGSFSIATKYITGISDFNVLEADALNKVTTLLFKRFKNFLYLMFMSLFPIFIGFKSLQIFRDEMDDGTLLILSSMPFTRFKLIVQKWLSLQVICLMFTLTVIFVSPVLFLSIEGFSKFSQETTKTLFKNSFALILTSIIFQLLVSTFTVFISLFFGKIGTISFLFLFIFILGFLNSLPSMVKVIILGGGNPWILYNTLSDLGQLSDKANLFQYYGDPDLKDFFELENWYTNQELELESANQRNYQYYDNENKKDFKLTFEPSFIVEFDDLISSKNSNDFLKKKQDFLGKEIKVIDINYNSPTPKAIQKLLDLLKKVIPKTINVLPIDVKYELHDFHRPYSIKDSNISKLYETRNYNLIKSYDEYKKALDNNKSLTEKENKIVSLSKGFFEAFQKNYFDDLNISKLTFIQHNSNTEMFVESLAKQYLDNKKIPNNDNKYHEIVKEINELLINDERGTNNSIAYFIDNDAFQNINFLMKELYPLIQKMNHFSASQEDINNVNKFLKVIKINNYLNIITQMKFIWDGENKNNISELDSEFLQTNYYGKWELKEINYSKQDGTKETKKYVKIVPGSFKKLLNRNILCIVYPIISLCLISLLILMVYRKDFT